MKTRRPRPRRDRNALAWPLLLALLAAGAPVTAAAQAAPSQTAQPASTASVPPGGAAQDAPADQAAGDVEAEAEPAEPIESSIFHHPPAVVAAESAVALDVEITGDWKLARAWIAARPAGSGSEWRDFELKRTSENVFSARLDDDLIAPPGVEYYVASRDTSGNRRLHFGSPEQPYQMLVHPTQAQLEHTRQLAAYDNRRAEFGFHGQYTAYGRRQIGAEATTTRPATDSYWTGELSYTYRFLSLLHDLRFGVGMLRGSHAEVLVDGQAVPVGLDQPLEGAEAGPGMDYGFGSVMLRRDYLMLRLGLTLGASQQGFITGGDVTVGIGEPEGTRLEIGGELLQDIGNRGFLAFHWDTVPRVPMALTIELSERPDANAVPTGTRLIYTAGYEATEAITVSGDVGYASRSSGIEGGWVGGLAGSYSF